MADISVTAGSVTPGTGAQLYGATAGATLTAGQGIYLDSSDSMKAKLADANDGASKAAVAGVTVNGAATGQKVNYQKTGEISIGTTTLTVGQTYINSSTPGGIAPISDLSTGNYVSILGVATSASNLKLGILNSGATRG